MCALEIGTESSTTKCHAELVGARVINLNQATMRVWMSERESGLSGLWQTRYTRCERWLIFKDKLNRCRLLLGKTKASLCRSVVIDIDARMMRWQLSRECRR